MDDTTRGVGGDDLTGRSEETTRNYAGEPPKPTTRRPASSRSTETTRTAGEAPATEQDSDLDPESERRTRELQGEIANTRAELSETIEAIQDRLRPANLVSDAKDQIKTATTEKVKSMADTASGTAQEMMRGTREYAQDFVQGARQNPIPALMIGAGVAWLVMDRSRKTGTGRGRSSRSSEYSSPRYGYQGTDYYASPDYSESSGYERSAGRSGSSASSYRGGSTVGTGSTAGTGSSYGATSEDLSTRAREVAEQARRRARRTTNNFQRTLNENPLLVGAAAVLVGAAVGASLPETERENEWMGEARDSVVERAQEVAKSAAKDAASTVASGAVDKVADKTTK